MVRRGLFPGELHGRTGGRDDGVDGMEGDQSWKWEQATLQVSKHWQARGDGGRRHGPAFFLLSVGGTEEG